MFYLSKLLKDVSVSQLVRSKSKPIAYLPKSENVRVPTLKCTTIFVQFFDSSYANNHNTILVINYNIYI